MLADRPLLVVGLVSLSFWVLFAWLLVQLLF
jgi:hypothetical protein